MAKSEAKTAAPPKVKPGVKSKVLSPKEIEAADIMSAKPAPRPKLVTVPSGTEQTVNNPPPVLPKPELMHKDSSSVEAALGSEVDQSIKAHLQVYSATVNSVVQYLEIARRNMVAALVLAKDSGGRSNDYATIYAAIYRGNAVLEEANKPLGAVLGELKNIKVPEAFERDDIKTLTMADGARITISNVVRASVIGGKKDEAFAWLRSTDQADLITETLNASTLTAFARSLMEQNKSLPEELFNVVVMPTVSLTGSKKK